MCATRAFILFSSCGWLSYSGPSHSFGAAQLLNEISFERSAHGCDRNQMHALATQRVDGRILLSFVDDGSDRISGDVAFGSQSLDRGRHLRTPPDHLHFALNAGSQISNRADPAKFPFVNDSDAVAERFGIGKNVGGEEDGFAFVLELLHEVPHFAPAHRVKP